MVQNLIGQLLLDRFRVEALLGEGAFARVYRVHDVRRGVDLAAKVLRQDIAHDPAFVERFRREAGVLEQLKHPHIVRYYETVETPDGIVFILMDYIEGTTLQTYLYHRKSPIPPHDTLKYARPICSALGYAHRENIIHRDVKPGNILLADNGQIYVTDFGIARLLNEASTLTQGLTIGTPTYMAPEQLMGRPVTPAADIYAFGVVLYQMMTQRVPFRGDNPGAEGTTVSDRVAYEHIHHQPQPPSQLNPAITPAVESVIMRCLKKNAAERFPTAPAIYEALAQAVGETPLPAQDVIAGTPNPPSVTLPEWSMLMRQVEGQQGKPPASPTSAQPAPTGQQAPPTPGMQQPSRFGTAAGAPPPQAPTAGNVVRSQQMPTMPNAGPGPTVVASGRQPAKRDTQPHPTIPSAYAPPPGAQPPGAQYQSQQGYPPNYGSQGYGDPYQANEAAERRRQMMVIGGVVGAGLLVLVFCIGAALLLMRGDDENTNPTPRPTNVAAAGNVTLVPTSSTRPGEPLGEVLVYSKLIEGDYDIFRINLDNGQTQRLTSGPLFEFGAVASPDGTRIAYHAASSASGAGDIYIMDANGQNPRQLTNTPADERFPSWSPDGTRLVYQSNAEGDYDLVAMTIANQQTQKLTTASSDEVDPAWSPDGTRIAFASDADADGAFEIYVINSDGSNQRQLTNRTWASARRPAWAPDSSRIMFQTSENNVDLIYAVNPDGNGVQRLFAFNDQRSGAWSHIVRKVAFVSGSGDAADVYVADFTRGVAYKVIDDALYPDWLH